MPGVPTPVLITEQWAESASTTYVTTPMPIPTQVPTSPGRASYATGFPPQTFESIGAGGTGPDGRDLNGVLADITSNVAAFCGGQLWGFNASWASANGGYIKGAIVTMANATGLWINTVNGNTNNPDTSPAQTSGWVPLTRVNAITVTTTGGTTTLTAVQAACGYIVIAGALTSNATIVLPSWGMIWFISNQTTGAFSVTISSSGTIQGSVPQGGGVATVVVDPIGNVDTLCVASAFNS